MPSGALDASGLKEAPDIVSMAKPPLPVHTSENTGTQSICARGQKFLHKTDPPPPPYAVGPYWLMH
ncbi:hypothetical protein JRY29_03045 [Salmonella enterica subsp. enterica serovar Kentucky]|nr:hypothetical protein JRY29_03045 [Salmonella enterica subsp. enterica serovar Kentucky]